MSHDMIRNFLTTNRIKRKPQYSCIICIIGGSILMSIWFCNRNRQNAGLSSVLSKMHGVIIKFSNTIVFLCVIIVSCCFCCCLPNNWKLNTFVTSKNTWNLRCIYEVYALLCDVPTKIHSLTHKKANLVTKIFKDFL